MDPEELLRAIQERSKTPCMEFDHDWELIGATENHVSLIIAICTKCYYTNGLIA